MSGNLRRIALFVLVGGWVTSATLSACTGDDSTTGGGPDASDATAPNDVAPGDSKSPVDSATNDSGGAIRGNVIAFNNLVTKISPVRYCFAASATGDPGLSDGLAMTPQPADPAGLAPGFFTQIDGPPELETENVKVFVYYVQSLDAFGLSGKSCTELLAASLLLPPVEDAGPDAGDAGDAGPPPPIDAGGAMLVQTADFDVDTLPAGAISSTARTVLYTTGCPMSSDASKLNLLSPKGNGYCGKSPAFPNRGDFHVFAATLDSSAASSATDNRAQGIEGLSFAKYLTAGAEFTMSVIVGDASTQIMGPDNDAGTYSFMTNGPVQPVPGTEIPALPTVTGLHWAANFGPAGFYDPANALLFSGLSAADVKAGKSYTLVLMGSFFEPATYPDGGPNPFAIGYRYVPNQ